MEQPLNLQNAIYNLQKYLRAISFADERVSRPPLDGIFDSATEESVRSFQESHQITPNGIVDRETWYAIYGEYKALALTEELPSDTQRGSARKARSFRSYKFSCRSFPRSMATLRRSS